MSRFWLPLALLCAASSFLALAQQKRGASPNGRTIEGSVLDPGGHPVPGAVVLLEDLKSLQIRSYIVQEDGKFRFSALSTDSNYELTARFHGVNSAPKTIGIFENKPEVVVTLRLTLKPKHPAAAQRGTGNSS